MLIILLIYILFKCIRNKTNVYNRMIELKYYLTIKPFFVGYILVQVILVYIVILNYKL